MAQFVNEYQKNEYELNRLFDSLSSWDKGKFIEKNLKYLDYTRTQHHEWRDLTEQEVLSFIDNDPNILDTIINHYRLDYQQ